MPGRPDFTDPQTGGKRRVTVSNRPEVREIGFSSGNQIASGDSEVREVFAPTGAIFRAIGIDIAAQPVANATTGTHRISVRPLNSAVALMRAEGSFDQALTFRGSEWNQADLNVARPTPTGQESVRSLRATENAGIAVKYVNETDAATDGFRFLTLVAEEESF